MFLTIVIVTVIFLVLFLTQRYRKKMAALIAWIIGSIVSKNSAEEESLSVTKPNQKYKKKSPPKTDKESPKKHKHQKDKNDLYKTYDNLRGKKNQTDKDLLSSLVTDKVVKHESFEKISLVEQVSTVGHSEIKPVHIKPEKSRKKNVSKSVDKLQNNSELNLSESFKFQEKNLEQLDIQKSTSLPDFHKSVKTLKTFTNNKVEAKEVSSKNKAVLKLEPLLKAENTQATNLAISLQLDDDNKDLFTTVSHRRQTNKKTTNENIILHSSTKALHQKLDKPAVNSLPKLEKIEINKLEINNKDIQLKKQTGYNSSYLQKGNTQPYLVTKEVIKDNSLDSAAENIASQKQNLASNINKQTNSDTHDPNNTEIRSAVNNKIEKSTFLNLPENFQTNNKEAISHEIEKQKKLPEAQCEAEILPKNLLTVQNQESLNCPTNFCGQQKVATKVDLIHETKLIDKEVFVKPEITKPSEVYNNSEENHLEAKVAIAVIKNQTVEKSLALEENNFEPYNLFPKEHNLTSQIKVHSEVITYNKEATDKEEELTFFSTPVLKQTVSPTLGLQSDTIVANIVSEALNSDTKQELGEASVRQVKTFTYSAPKSKNSLPPSAIIEHYKGKYKGSPSSQANGVLLESSISIVSKPILPSNTPKDSNSSHDKGALTVPTKHDLTLKKVSSAKMKSITQIRVLTLNDKEHQDQTLYRIEKKWILQFRLGSSLLGRKVSLYCNYPDKKHSDFDRNKYYLLQWNLDEGCCNSDDTALFTQISVQLAGSFHYYFIYENATESGPQGSGYFLVDPVLKYGDNEELPLNCIQCQTVLSKCIGSFSSWEDKLRVSKESGYNMIHFTPVQELGKSNSAYSLSTQLKLNPIYNENNKQITFDDVEQLISKLRTEWKVLSICDIVLNHTANETDWLQEHPESTYNCSTCSYMRPAYLLDAALAQFSEDVKKGYYESMGIPAEITSEDHLNSIRYSLHTKVLKEANIPELFICDVNKLVSQFQDLARKSPPAKDNEFIGSLKLIQDPAFRRLASTVDMIVALKLFNVYRPDSFDDDERIKRCSLDFKTELDKLNNNIVNEINNHLNAAMENVIAGIRYFRVQHDGPKIREISIKNPLCSRYFTDYGEPKSLKEYEEIMYSENSKYLMAHNGWVMNADPMRNFADADSQVYIRRELIAWGDSVKLRYGDKPEDSPFLWTHMKAYVELTAKVFDGVRLDNCHSTPIPVAEYLLDCARKVRPDLYVVAELFTNSDNTDNVFVNRLGITSLIREAMSAWDSHEEGRLVYRYGGEPVGAFFQPYCRPLVPSVAHALFLDLTHDNPSPVEKRSIFDLLPSAALVNMACCASGSNRGYDELVNHHIHVVDEGRQYTEWTDNPAKTQEKARYVSNNSGIISAKKCINNLHFKLGKEGFTQVYVDQIDPDIVAVTRHQPNTHESVVLVAFTAFSHPNLNAANYQRGIKPLRVEGVLNEIVLEATLSHVKTGKGSSKYGYSESFVQDTEWINGVSEYQVSVKEHLQLVDSDFLELSDSGNPNITQLNFKNFKPGSVVAIRVSPQKHVQESISKLRELTSEVSKKDNSGLSNIINKMNLADLNRALYRCDQEEKDEGYGFSAYNIPNFGSLVYCGFQGFISLLSTIRASNDLGHPMCSNLRDGNWMIDYICQRLKVDEGTKPLGQWIDRNIEPIKNIPRYLVPSYFDVAITSLYMVLLEQSYNLMSDFVRNGSTFVKGLSLGSLQFSAVIKSADLPKLSLNLAPPKPPTKLNNRGEVFQACVTLSAGLPHFSVGYMRNWGRDTFIALRGLYILTGRVDDARYHILGYAACLRHGLIPNLLDGGINPRFNCRDAVWWWLYCIKSFVQEVPNGVNILSDKVSRIFPTDESPPTDSDVVDQPLYDVIQEALKIHFQGLTFRERNAGRQIDAQMTDQGFNNQIGIHPETGFVFGGNEFNCGTWMDKMGSSDKAGNRGKPATPRDGSAIELIGLSSAVVVWLSELHKTNQYPYDGVERVNKNGVVTKWTYDEWSNKLKTNFERYFWVDSSSSEGEARPDLINKRGIYKDTYGATQVWADFQLRCNFPIAMVAAPHLFNPQHAWVALQQAEKHILGPLGMKTLDPDDWAYCGDYNNADDSTNSKTANGFNYHQGPEWVWPIGYYLRAKLYFAAENGELMRTIAHVKVILSKHFTELQTSPWRGLPELTNSNGSFCNDSSRTQAWSMACVLEVLHDLQKIESSQHHLTSN